MFRFYERAHICFAYLRDVDRNNFRDDFVKSVWFTRGWTLQELLAPTDLYFYDRDWNPLGSKSSLSRLISAATGIPDDVLSGNRTLQECSVAQRMSWAARRVTSRIEDRAYSLLGIFDVNMTMLYGEGPKSFLRLQEEIFKRLDDYSIFVWKGLQPGLPGLLASSPTAFTSSGTVQNIAVRNRRRPYSINNRGLYGLIPLIPYTLDTYVTLLPCTYSTPNEYEEVGLFLRRLHDDDQFMRVSVHGKELIRDGTTWLQQRGLDGVCLTRDIGIRQNPLLPKELDHAYIDRVQGFRLNRELLEGDGNVAPPFIISGVWDSDNQIISLPPGSRRIHHVGAINIGSQEQVIEVVRFGFDYDYNPLIYLTQKGVQYSEKEDDNGIFIESFGEPTGLGNTYRASFQNGLPTAFTNRSRLEELPDGRWASHMSEKVDGFWALTVDRLDALDVYMTDSGRRLAEDSEGGFVGRVRLRRAVVNERLVWDLQLDELARKESSNAAKMFRGNHQRSEDHEQKHWSEM